MPWTALAAAWILKPLGNIQKSREGAGEGVVCRLGPCLSPITQKVCPHGDSIPGHLRHKRSALTTELYGL